MSTSSKKSLILGRNAHVLREVSKEVEPQEIGSEKIGQVIERMKTALSGEHDGVAIAAPQIGESLRIFVVSGRALSKSESAEDMVFINPEITKLSKKKKKVEEGCLSLRYLYGQVERAEKATVKALDENGKKFEKGGSGLLAQIFQHEVDHLNGILFIDKAENIVDIPPEKL